MKKGIKLLVWVIAGIPVLALGAVLVIANLDADLYKSFVAGQLSKSLNRSLEIRGNLDVSFYPWLGIDASGVVLENANGFGDRPMVEIGRIAARTRTLELLKSQVHMDVVTLKDARVRLVRNRDGKTNFDDLAGRTGGTATGETGGETAGKTGRGATGETGSKATGETGRGPDALGVFLLGGLDIQGLDLSWDDQAQGAQYDITGFNLTTGEVVPGKPLDIRGGFHARSNRPELDAKADIDGTLEYDLEAAQYRITPLTLSLTAHAGQLPGGSSRVRLVTDIHADLKADTLSLSNIKADGLDTDLSGAISLDRFQSPAPAVSADLDIRGKDLALWFKALEIQPLAGQLATLKDRGFNLDLAATLDQGSGLIDVNRFSARVVGADISGSLSLDGSSPGLPAVNTRLSAKGPDLPFLLRVAGQFQGGESGLAGLGRDLAGIKKKAFKIDTQIEADPGRGRVNIQTLSIDALGVTATGRLDGRDLSSDKAVLSGELSAKAARLPGLLKALGRKDLAGLLSSAALTTKITSKQGEISLAPLSVSAGLSGKGFPGKAAGLKLSADTRYRPAQQDLAVDNLQLTGLGLNLSGNVTAKNIMGSPAYHTDITLDGKDLPGLLRTAGTFQGKGSGLATLAKDLAGVKKKAFRIAARMDADPGKGLINIQTLSIDALGVAASARMDGRDLYSDKGSVNGELSLKADRLPGLLTAMGQKELAGILSSAGLTTKIIGKTGVISFPSLSVSAVLSGKQVAGPPAPVTISADTQYRIAPQALTLDKLRITGLGLDLSGSVSARNILKAPAYTGQISLARFNPRALMKKLKQKVPKTADNRTLQALALKTGFAGGTDRFQLDGLALDLDRTKINGSLAIKGFDRPVTRFDLVLDKIDLDRYLPPPTQAKKTAKTPETGAAGAALNLPMDLLRSLDVKGDFKAGNLKISNLRTRQVSARIEAKNGNIRLSPVSAKLYEGAYNGDIALDVRGKAPKLRLRSKVMNINAESLLTDMTGKAKIRGRGDFSADLTTAGGTEAALRKNLNGRMAFVFKNGAVKGFNIGKFLRRVKSLKQNLSLRVSDKEETDFTEMTGNPVVTNGVVRLDDLSAKSPALRLSGKGVAANLVTEQMDFLAKATVVETSKGQAGKDLASLRGVTIPVHIQGALKNPRIRPDIRGLVSGLATDELTKGLKENLPGKLGIQLPGQSGQGKQQAAPKQQPGKPQPVKQQPPVKTEDVLKKTLEKGLDNLFNKLTN